MTGIDVAIALYAPRTDWLRSTLAALRPTSDGACTVWLREDPSPAELGHEAASALGAELGVDVRYARNRERLGMVGNWTATVADGSAPHVVLLGQDDEVPLSELLNLAALLDAHPDAPFIAFDRQVLDEHGQPVRPGPSDRSRLYDAGQTFRLPSSLATRLCLRNGQVLGEPATVVMRRTALETSGGWDPALEAIVDLDLLLRMLESTPACLYAAVSPGIRRSHASSQTSRQLRDGTSGREREALYVRYRHSPGVSAADRSVARAFIVTRELIRAGMLEPQARRGALGRVLRHGAGVWPWHWVRFAIELARGRAFDRRLVQAARLGPY